MCSGVWPVVMDAPIFGLPKAYQTPLAKTSDSVGYNERMVLLFLRENANLPGRNSESQMDKKEIATFYPATTTEWRKWLEANHDKEQSVWLIQYKKDSNVPSITWSQAVDEALCFGWIDSTSRPIDHEKFMQYFTKRKKNSVWSKINKDKVASLIEEGRMTHAGFHSIEIAKENGSWHVLDEAEALTMPMDLAKEFNAHPGSEDFFLSLSPSTKKNMLQWLVLAKRPETRQKRLIEIAALAAQKMKPKQFR
jgi:uncharacterized protein YdeI (YjbR/CyaY-like superfamily)